MIDTETVADTPGQTTDDDLQRLLEARPGAAGRPAVADVPGVGVASPAIGILVAFADAATPLVVCPGIGGPALAARTTVDLGAEHIGAEVLLLFEGGDPARPIVIGRLRRAAAWPAKQTPPQVDVDADGRRLTLSVKEQLVLRCGQASITLTAAGKVLIQGTYVSSRSTGVNRVKGGSVQLN
jgi:hypothetical protein